jgi:UDP-glucuronate 4-epimerase
MKVLVTGSAGFIGSYVSRALLLRGDSVVGIDNFYPYYPRQAKEYNNKLTQEEALKTGCEYKFIEGDIRDAKLLDTLFKTENLDKVIHLAAMAGVPASLKDPKLYVEVNVDGTTNLLDCCAKFGILNFVFASSSSVYGNRKDVPFKETDNVDYPISPYAATKRMGEILLWTYNHLYKFPISALRFFGVYGPLQRPYGMVIQRFIKQLDHGEPFTIYGDGSMARDYTYIDDIVAGVLSALDKNYAFEIFNLGNSYPVTVLEIAKEVEKQMEKTAKINFVDQPPTEVAVTYADLTKSKEMLGYNPTWQVSRGIEKQVEEYLKMSAWYKDMPW